MPVPEPDEVGATYPVSERQMEELRVRFTYHPPSADQQARYSNIRQAALYFAQMLCEYCPESRERSSALTRLEETVMHANAAIARRE